MEGRGEREERGAEERPGRPAREGMCARLCRLVEGKEWTGGASERRLNSPPPPLLPS